MDTITPEQRELYNKAQDAYWAHLFTERVMLMHEQVTSPNRYVAIEKTCARHAVWRGLRDCVNTVQHAKELLKQRAK